MGLVCVVLLAVGVLSGAGNTADRHRRLSNVELFLNLIRGGQGDGSPILVVPIEVNGNSALLENLRSVTQAVNNYRQPGYPSQQPVQQYQQPGYSSQQTFQQNQNPQTSRKSARIDVEFISSPGIYVEPETNNLNFRTYNNKVEDKKVGTVEVEILPSIEYNYELESESQREEFIPVTNGPQIYDTSSKILQSFRHQRSVAAALPVVIPDFPLPDRLPVPAPVPYTPPMPTSTPNQPDFNRSLRLRVDLTVPTSGYTEAYDIQWHAETNTARIVVEDGSTTTYRAPLNDGRIEFLEAQVDKPDGIRLRRCTLSPRITAAAADRTFPGLPDMTQYQFSGYMSAEGRYPVERWVRVMAAGPGQGGAVAGESLTFTHEMLVVREGGLAVPLKYSMVIDSSIIGPASDSYVHRYSLLPPPTTSLVPNTTQVCDYFGDYQDDDANDYQTFYSKVISRFEPIREFAVDTRDARYDTMFINFKEQFKRNYMDSTEEAVRKNLLIKSTRYIEAGNRVSSGFKMAANFLTDKLDTEIDTLLGVQALPAGSKEASAVPFPYSEEQVKKMSNTLGDEFDWRPLGAVSPVRYQEATCSSCWAFAVAGSTEGALFKKTKKLVPLSPQCLVDCGKPFGANGCNGTWPNFAFDYIKARGLPAWSEYPDYQAKVLECKDKSVPPVTHITGHANVMPNNVDALKVAIKNHGPTVVIVDSKASSFIYYKSGVLKDKRCGINKPKLNHAVLAVGWGTKDGPHFIIKNTYSAGWGEEGYIRISPESCAVLEKPSYALIEKQNIDRADLRAAADSVKED